MQYVRIELYLHYKGNNQSNKKNKGFMVNYSTYIVYPHILPFMNKNNRI
jgi:hypothetical protein